MSSLKYTYVISCMDNSVKHLHYILFECGLLGVYFTFFPIWLSQKINSILDNWSRDSHNLFFLVNSLLCSASYLLLVSICFSPLTWNNFLNFKHSTRAPLFPLDFVRHTCKQRWCIRTFNHDTYIIVVFIYITHESRIIQWILFVPWNTSLKSANYREHITLEVRQSQKSVK